MSHLLKNACYDALKKAPPAGEQIIYLLCASQAHNHIHHMIY
jgi:hypothetical protein